MSFLDRLRALVRPAAGANPSPNPLGQPVLDRTAEAYFADEGHWKDVTSSNVHQVALYVDLENRRNLLGVRFWPDGQPSYSEYVYWGVPLSLFTSMLAAGSKGRFVHEKLKHQFPYRKTKAGG